MTNIIKRLPGKPTKKQFNVRVDPGLMARTNKVRKRLKPKTTWDDLLTAMFEEFLEETKKGKK